MTVYTGTNADDVLVGTLDSDEFLPLLGIDSVDGGGGVDRLVVNYTGVAGSGFGSSIQAGAGFFFGNLASGAGLDRVSFKAIEQLEFTAGDGADYVSVDAAPLAAGATLAIDGGAGDDRLDIRFADLADATQFIVSGATVTGNRGSFTRFESFGLLLGDGENSVTLGTGADSVAGGNGTDRLDGGGGNDIINGGGGADSLDGGSGNDLLFSNGRIGTNLRLDEAFDFDVISAGDGNDGVVFGIGDSADGGAGRDRLAISLVGAASGVVLDLAAAFGGGSSAFAGGVITGFEAVEFILGSAFDDVISIGDAALVSTDLLGGLSVGSGVLGNNGNDRLTGGLAANLFYGGAGNDRLIGLGGNDTLDGGSGNDNIEGGDGNDRIEAGGNNDAVLGGAGNDIISGDAGADSLDGGEGNDRIFSDTATLLFDTGLGVDTLYGGGGDDVLAAGFGDSVDGGDGSDGLLLNLAAGTSAANLDLGAAFAGGSTTGPGGSFTGIERYGYVIGTAFGDAIAIGDGILDAALVFDSTRPGVSGGDGADRLIGGANADRLYGDAGRDILLGLGGDDLLDAGIGNDQLYGGAGDDIYFAEGFDLVFELDGEGTDTIEARSDFYLFANVENLRLAEGVGSAFGVGNALANEIEGNEGDNLLIAQGGNDIVFGRDGNDTIFGQGGDDLLSGDDGIDYVVGGNVNDGIDGEAGADALYGEAGDDFINGGDSFDTDILVGGNGNDILDAASGLGDYDLVDGGAGDDVYHVDTPADLTFEAVDGGTDTIVADIAGAGYYLYANTENLILEGQTPFGVGNEGDNVLTGNAIGNYLLGGQGNDTLNGKAGNDVLFGEAGVVIFVVERGTGGDVIGDFQAGVDKINLVNLGFTSYAELQASIFEVAGTSAINLGQGDFIVINGITNAALSALDFQFG